MEHKIGEEVGHGQSDSVVYSLEVRLLHDFGVPFKYGDMIIDNKWRGLSLLKVPFGVPNGILDPLPNQHGYVSHDSGMALAYWFLAEVKYRAVEVRLIEHKFITNWSDKIIRELEPIRSQMYNFPRDKK